MIREQKGDIFSSEDNLAHCVSMDFAMFKGVAKEFKSRFGKRGIGSPTLAKNRRQWVCKDPGAA